MPGPLESRDASVERWPPIFLCQSNPDFGEDQVKTCQERRPGMSWAKRGRHLYLVRWRWEDGKSVSQYVGRGPAAAIAAKHDRLERLERDAARRAWDVEAARSDEAARASKAYEDLCKLLVRATLIVAGFHQHQGEWRRRREPGIPNPDSR